EPLAEQLRVGPGAKNLLARNRELARHVHGCPGARRGVRPLCPRALGVHQRRLPFRDLARNLSNESSWPSQKLPSVAIHSSAPRIGSSIRRQWRIRPCFVRTSSPASSSTERCLEIAGSDISNGSASSPTEASPRVSRSTIARRVGSARAPKVAPRGSSDE